MTYFASFALGFVIGIAFMSLLAVSEDPPDKTWRDRNTL